MPPAIIRRTILAELAAYGAGLTAEGLLELVRLKLRETTLGDVIEELVWLHDHGQVARIDNALDPDNRALRVWTITERGQLTLKK